MNSSPSHRRADRLLGRVQANIDGSASNGVVLNDLLDEFCNGLPVEKVLPLLESENASVARAGAWIVSELGSRACSLFETIKRHLDSDDPSVRFCIADCVLLCAKGTDAEPIAKTAHFLEDPDASVRWKAIDTLIKLNPQQVSACARFLEENASTGHFLEGFKQLTVADSAPQGFTRVLQVGQPADPVTNKFSFIAAIRSRVDRRELERIVLSTNDQDLREFLDDFEY